MCLLDLRTSQWDLGKYYTKEFYYARNPGEKRVDFSGF
jgi:hypothetical protein